MLTSITNPSTKWVRILGDALRLGRSIFYPNPPQDGQFLHKGVRIFKSKKAPKNEPFGNFFQRFRQKINPSDFFFKGCRQNLRGWNPAVFRGSADKKWNDPFETRLT